MLSLLLVAPAIIVSDVATRQDERCTKPYTLSPSGKCVRRIAADAPDEWEEQARRTWEDYVNEALGQRCTGRRCR